jgi:hypothetical protein
VKAYLVLFRRSFSSNASTKDNSERYYGSNESFGNERDEYHDARKT